jgi:hypothetical protein
MTFQTQVKKTNELIDNFLGQVHEFSSFLDLFYHQIVQFSDMFNNQKIPIKRTRRRAKSNKKLEKAIVYALNFSKKPLDTKTLAKTIRDNSLCSFDNHCMPPTTKRMLENNILKVRKEGKRKLYSLA